MAPYKSHGFIGQEIVTWIKTSKKTHKELFVAAEKLNADCYRSLSAVTIDPSSLRQTLISCLLARCIELFQATYILIAHGMSSPASIMLRSLMETTFILCATAKDDDALNAYIINGERERLRITNKILANGDKTFSKIPVAVLQDIKKELDEKMKKQKVKKFSTEDFARKANLHSWYSTAYVKTSWAVHATIGDVEQYLVLDKRENIKKIKFVPTDKDTSAVLSAACNAMIISLGESLVVFGADTAIAHKHSVELERLMTQV